MGYAKNTGSLKDTVLVLFGIVFLIQLTFLVIAAFAGDYTLFWTLQVAILIGVKESVWSWTSLIVLPVVVLLAWVLYSWRDSSDGQ